MMLPSGLPEQVHDEEDAARFITSKKHFNTSGAKPSAFFPSPKDGATSVFRQSAMPREALWRTGDDNLNVHRIYGAAMTTAYQVRSASLEILSKEPPPRHANITGWPVNTGDPELQKAAQIEQALLISEHSELIIR